jgi:Di-haem cytochrome c peroxidase/Imelysin
MEFDGDAQPDLGALMNVVHLQRENGRADERSSAHFRVIFGAHMTRLADLARVASVGAALFTATIAVAMAGGAHAVSPDAIEQYRSCLIQDVDHTVSNVRKLRARIAAGDLVGARIGWERSEVFTSGFVPELDQKIDAWPNGLVGFHAIEAKLFGAGKTDVGPEVDALLENVSELSASVREIGLTAQGLLNGVARLAYEVGESKVDGGESRVSGTSLDDMRNNVDGIDLAYRILFAPTIEADDAQLAAEADFVRNVIVGEFAGPEPSPAMLDALVAYIEDIDFLPNLRLSAGGHLTTWASPAERRGEALFFKPFPHDSQLSCAACHIPTAAFVDHKQHAVGSGGLFKTPTLLNANFNAPYFHDGRYDTYDQVVAHFDRTFELGLSPEERSDIIAYLRVVGDGLQPYELDGVTVQLKEINDFASVLAFAIPDHDTDVIALAVQTVGRELRELAEQFPALKDTTVTGGAEERLAARKILKELVLIIRRIGVAASSGRFDDAAAEYRNYRTLALAPGTAVQLKTAEPWSLFNPKVHGAHFAGLRDLLASAEKLHR